MDSNYQDAIGDEVVSRDGATVGHVKKIVDQPGQQPFLQVEDDGLFGIGAQHFLVPVDAILSINDGKVQVNRTKQDLVGIPAHSDDEPYAPAYFESLYSWWWRPTSN